MEAFQQIQLLGRDRTAHLEIAEEKLQEALDLVHAARLEGYSQEAIARALGMTRQNLYLRLSPPTTK